MLKKSKTPPSVGLALARVRTRAMTALRRRPSASPPSSEIPILGFAIPRVVKPTNEITSLRLDHRAGFLLANVDGETGVQALVDLSGLPKDEVLAILRRLVKMGVVTIT